MSELLNSDNPRGYRKLTESEEELDNAIVDLMTHGKKVFGDYPTFVRWLNTNNLSFNNKLPGEFLNSIDEIRFIDNLLNNPTIEMPGYIGGTIAYNSFEKEFNNIHNAINKLYEHGKEVFGSYTLFSDWLNKDNFYFDKKPPAEMLDTLEGIKFIDEQLTGMQHGDNA